MFVELFAQTDVGRVRQGNEDNFLVLDLAAGQSWTATDSQGGPTEALHRFEVSGRGLVLIVSDGMGGALAGDVASRMAVETVREMLVEKDTKPAAEKPDAELSLSEVLANATNYANYAIHRKSLEDPRCSGMGATLTAAAVAAGSLALVQVGDSRAYVIRGGQIKLVTKDQSLVQQLVDARQITEEDAETHMFRNVILQALGAQDELTPAITSVTLCRGDIALLCSDGLSGKLRGEDMHEIVGAAGGDLAAACDALIREANRRGGEDNITVVLARFEGDELPAPTPGEIEVIEPPGGGGYTYDTSEDDTSPIP